LIIIRDRECQLARIRGSSLVSIGHDINRSGERCAPKGTEHPESDGLLAGEAWLRPAGQPRAAVPHTVWLFGSGRNLRGCDAADQVFLL
jgi:hypothetical protein